jgi:hypothetical protein
MGHAYTPGLKVKDRLLVKKQRILPLKGDVLVKVGDQVSPDTAVARTELPGNVVPINVANKLGIPPEDIEMVMLKKVGDPIKNGEMIALSKTFFIFKNHPLQDKSCNAACPVRWRSRRTWPAK